MQQKEIKKTYARLENGITTSSFSQAHGLRHCKVSPRISMPEFLCKTKTFILSRGQYDWSKFLNKSNQIT